MAYGLELINDLGSLSITEKYRNPILAQSGNMTTQTLSNGTNFSSYAEVSYTRNSLAELPILAIRPSGATALLGIADSDTLTWTWIFYSTLAAGQSIPYWLFADEEPVDADSWGMHIFDASGNRIYSTAEKPMRMIDLNTPTVPNTSIGSVSYTYTAGRTYAAALVRWAENSSYILMTDETKFRWGCVTGITDGIAVTGFHAQTNSGNTPSPADWTTMRVPIIDVTNY